MGVQSSDQGDFLFPPPALQLFLSRYGFVNVVVRFPVDQAVDVVTIGETFDTVEFVLEDALVEVAGHSDI